MISHLPGSPSRIDPRRDWRVDSRLKWHLEQGTLPRSLLICGPAGTGKTFGLLSVLHCLARDYPRLRILFVRQTRASLTESVLVTFEEEILPADGMESIAEGVRRENRTRYQYPSGTNIVLGGMDRPTKVLSTVWDIVYFNEAIESTQEGWESIASRMGRPGRDPRFGFLIGDTNPGNPSHWLLSHCAAGRTAYWDTTHKANPALHDGRDWTAAGVRYRTGLEATLTGTRRARLLEGLWAVGEGLWFDGFDLDKHVTETAEFDPAKPVCLAVDPGVFTGAVAFQSEGSLTKAEDTRRVNVFADFLTEDLGALANARALRALLDAHCGGRLDHGYADPAGGARNATGKVVLDTYREQKLRLARWPVAPVADGLDLIETLLARGRLSIHPRCERLIRAFQGYQRARRQGQWMDYPEDPQHPHEDVMDALRGGLYARLPARKRLQVWST